MGTIIFIYTTYISINYNYPFNAMDLSKATRTGPSAPSAAFPSLHGIESDMQREPCRNGIPQQVSILFWASRCQSCRLYHFIPQIFPPAYQHKQCIQLRCPWVKLTLSSARADWVLKLCQELPANVPRRSGLSRVSLKMGDIPWYTHKMEL